MQDFSFFLLKNLLPVGLAAIVFFGIGLLLAKLIWGRYTQRLANAVEENMNLASQWSALGSSQQDLFKKLRVRWQTDRDAYENEIAEKDRRIALLTESFQKSGKDVPDERILAAAGESATRLARIEADLVQERATTAKLRADLERRQEPTVLPFAVNTEGSAAPQDDLASRVRDLEQDLIDTHDELHRVRVDYQTQLQLVEALEAKLIAAPAAPVAEKVVVEKAAANGVGGAQMQALLAQRSRELRRFRSSGFGVSTEELESIRTEAGLIRDELETAKTEIVALEEQLSERETRIAEREAELKSRDAEIAAKAEEIAEREKEIAARNEEIAASNEVIAERTGDLAVRDASLEELRASHQSLQAEMEEARAQLAEMEVLRRRRVSLQAELNDACHELYDVRRALKGRIGMVGELEGRLGFLGTVETEKTALEAELAGVREQVASLEAEVIALRDSLATAEAEAAQLQETRRELSEIRIALSAKTAEHDQARAQMEELEAIIEDRGAEVNDLSAELRQQRDQVRLLKENLAEKQGELEALSEESRTLNAGVKARAQFTEELQVRVENLERALVERYNELNRARSEADDHARRSRRFETEAAHLGAELDRRVHEFNESDRRIFNAERALEESGKRIDDLSCRLAESDAALAELRNELSRVSREKEEVIRDLERASRRVTEMEEAARKREIEIIEIQRALSESEKVVPALQQRIDRLQTEVDSALEERRLSQITIGELEDALRASDERTLQLSARVDEKEAEAGKLAGELVELKSLVDQHRASEAEAQVRLSTLEKETENRIASIRSERDHAAETRSRETTMLAGEVATLRERLETGEAAHAGETAKLQEQIQLEAAARAAEAERLQASLSEIETLRQRLDARAESIRDLQNEISAVMMQRASREQEIAILKEKLRAMDEAHTLATLAIEEEESFIPLEELTTAVAAVEEAPVAEVAPPPPVVETREEPVAAWAGSEEEHVFFPEGSFALTRAETEKIDRCAASVRRLGRKVQVTVIGFSGGEGTPDFVESLSARRADAVRERLLERGVQQAIVKVRGAGQDRRFSDWKARRVEMIVSPVAVAESVN